MYDTSDPIVQLTNTKPIQLPFADTGLTTQDIITRVEHKLAYLNNDELEQWKEKLGIVTSKGTIDKNMALKELQNYERELDQFIKARPTVKIGKFTFSAKGAQARQQLQMDAQAKAVAQQIAALIPPNDVPQVPKVPEPVKAVDDGLVDFGNMKITKQADQEYKKAMAKYNKLTPERQQEAKVFLDKIQELKRENPEIKAISTLFNENFKNFASAVNIGILEQKAEKAEAIQFMKDMAAKTTERENARYLQTIEEVNDTLYHGFKPGEYFDTRRGEKIYVNLEIHEDEFVRQMKKEGLYKHMSEEELRAIHKRAKKEFEAKVDWLSKEVNAEKLPTVKKVLTDYLNDVKKNKKNHPTVFVNVKK